MDERARRDRGTIDRPAGTAEDVDLAAVLRGVADRIDALLEDGTSDPKRDGTGPGHDADAVAAWSSVVGAGTTSGDDRARRDALATTVLRMGADGSLDIVGDREDRDHDRAASDEEVQSDGDVGGAAREDALHPAAGPSGESRSDAHEDVDTRLRSARDRLARRRAEVMREAQPPSLPIWRRVDARKVVQRVLIAGAIVAVSALVSLLAT